MRQNLITKSTLWIAAVILFMTASDLCCQNAVTQATYSNNINHTIVREYTYPSTVSYIETSIDHYFAYSDKLMTVKNVDFSHDIFVTDFEIHNTYAYFCGYNDMTHKAVWGWFDVSTIDNGFFEYHIYDDFKSNGTYVDSLFSLEVYEEQGLTHIVTVGSTATTNGTEKWSCLIDISGQEGTLSGWSYKIGIADTYSHPFHRMTEVCVTDNYVVAAGRTKQNFPSEGYRVHLRGNLFMTGGPQDLLRYFSGGPYDPYHNGQGMKMTHTTGDNFASAARLQQGSPTIIDGVIINVFDVAHVLTGSGATPLHNMYCNITPVDGFSIRDIVYNETNNELLLLLSGKFVSGSSIAYGSTISTIPIPPTLTIDYFFLDQITLTSLCNYNNGNNFMSQGYDLNQNATSTYFTESLAPTTMCASQSHISPYSGNYGEKYDQSPYTVSGEAISLFSIAMNISSVITSVITCQ